VLKELFRKIVPQILPAYVTNAGSIAHVHHLVPVPWNLKHGPELVDFDDTKTNVFPKVTYRSLHRCSCGLEKVTSRRSLI
jgi:hypothetical protein